MSLFEILTKPTESAYAATAVSTALIQIVARDVLAFRRNTQVSYRVVEQASIIRNQIDTLIKEVDESTDESGWTAYEKYTKAVDPLEE